MGPTPLAELAKALAHHLQAPPAAALVAQAAPAALLLSIKPKYAELIESGHKQIEFRRRVPRAVGSGGLVLFYVSAPVQAIRLRARVAAVCRDHPADLWRRFESQAGTSRAEFEAYFAGSQTGVGLVLNGVARLEPPLLLRDERLRAADFRPPQSLSILGPGHAVFGAIGDVPWVLSGKEE